MQRQEKHKTDGIKDRLDDAKSVNICRYNPKYDYKMKHKWMHHKGLYMAPMHIFVD